MPNAGDWFGVGDLIGYSGEGDTDYYGAPVRRRRYSIGSNPRVGTLVKVANRVNKLLIKTEKAIRKIKPRRTGNRRPFGRRRYR